MSDLARERVVILDRDGTIVVDRNYLSDPAGLEFLPGAAEGLRSMSALGYRLIVITNQSGVGRGLFSMQCLQQMNQRLISMVAQAGARLERIYFCPHRPEEDCSCRKPRTKLLLDAAAELGFEPRHSVVIGDKLSDMQFGRNAGTVTMRIATDSESAQGSASADYTVPDLRAAAVILQTRAGRQCIS